MLISPLCPQGCIQSRRLLPGGCNRINYTNESFRFNKTSPHVLEKFILKDGRNWDVREVLVVPWIEILLERNACLLVIDL